jgi:hypothetical protein
MSDNHRPRSHTIAAALGSALTLALVACGGDDDASTADSSSDVAADDTTTTAAADGDSTTAGAGGPCDGLDEAAVAEVTGEVVDTGERGGEPVFGRGDGTEFDYAVEGCTFDVAVDGEEDPHVYSVSTGTAPDGIDLYDEFVSTRDPADVTQVTDLGDEAFVDASFGDQKIELIVRTGDGTALFVTSDPPFGVPVAGQDVLVGLAELALQ